MGKPFGVRTYAPRTGRGLAAPRARSPLQGEAVAPDSALDLLFVASMDNPQDGRWQRISVLDASGLTEAEGAHSPCRVLQTIRIDPKVYSGPHLLGVDERTGDLYAALVADKPLSTVLRFKCIEC